MSDHRDNTIRVHRRRIDFPTLEVVAPVQDDFINHWHFPIDHVSGSVGSEGATASVALDLAPTPSSQIATLPMEDLLEVRRELQRSANAVEHAMFLIDTCLNQRRSA